MKAKEIIERDSTFMGTLGELIYLQDYYDDIETLMIEFAKYHCGQQAKQIEEKAYVYRNNWGVHVCCEDSILNAYPLENIK